MSDYFLKESDLHEFVRAMMASKPVIGPVAKKSKFIFSELQAPEDLRLDYEVTLLPPKKVFFPPRQNLVTFTKDGPKSCVQPREQILFGVHFYDIKAIDMLDYLFSENNSDNNYLANRRATTLVGSSIQAVSPRAFWGSIGRDVKPKGHDAFLTKIRGGYHFETRTTRGEDLVKLGKFGPATAGQTAEAKKANEEVMNKCQEAIKYTSAEVSQKVRASFNKNEIWEGLAKDCFSCGSCNIVCPTCYCFDVQDKWNLDQVSGLRFRQWDSCLTEDFAKVSLGPTGAENFREKRGQRFRHRIMRKTTYLNEKLGGPACVGCGRCSAACVPDIADPVKIIKTIMES